MHSAIPGWVGPIGHVLARRKDAFEGVTKHLAGDYVQEEVTGVVRQTTLFYHLPPQQVLEVSTPRSVRTHLLLRQRHIAGREVVVEEVEHGGRQGGSDDVERNAE